MIRLKRIVSLFYALSTMMSPLKSFAHGTDHHHGDVAGPVEPMASFYWEGKVKVEVYPDAERIPTFTIAPEWPRLPDNTLIGQVSGVAVGADDTIWIVQRPKSISSWELGLEHEPAEALCCRSMHEVVQFSPEGTVLRQWTMSDTHPLREKLWPQSIHGIFVDSRNDIWLAGNGENDHVVLHFSDNGEFKGSFGERAKSLGNLDKNTLGLPADVYHDVKNTRAFIADGYLNRRVVLIDSQDYSFRNFFSAYGNQPQALEEIKKESHLSLSQGLFDPQAPHFSDIVHCVVGARDGMLYVCDRRHNRIQMFKMLSDSPDTLAFVGSVAIAGNTKLAGTVTDIAFSPDQTLLYAADMANSVIWVLRRSDMHVIAKLGQAGRNAGQFTWLHSLDADSKGNLYATEVGTGMRVHKLTFDGYMDISRPSKTLED